MSTKDYILLADIMGKGLAIAHKHGGEDARTELYDHCYTPLVDACKRDNPRFDMLKFSWATSQSEGGYNA